MKYLNFFFQVSKDSLNPNISEVNNDGYVLKVLNSEFSKNVGMVEGQNLMMKHLHEKEFNVPYPLKSLEGKTLTMKSLKKGIVV